MTITQILLLMLIVFVLPFFMGLFWVKENEGAGVLWIYGLLTEWAAFFIVCVPNIILIKSLDNVIMESGILFAVLAVASILYFAIGKRKYKGIVLKKDKKKLTVSEAVYLCIFIALWLFQMYKTIFYAFSDGDDSYYVALAQTSAGTGTMYVTDVYIGDYYSSINYRYALAPLPMWFAGISRITGINAALLSHTIMAPVLISATYIVYGALSKILFADAREKRYMFLTLMAVFCMFSNVSQSMAETFLLTRSRQGKAALANLIIPILAYVLMRIIKRAGKLTLNVKDVMLITVIILSGSLTSLFSNVLTSIILFGFLVYSFIKKSSLFTKAGICFPALVNVCVIAAYYLLSRG